MRSFTLAAFASLAFGILCSATPTPSENMVVPYPPRAIAARDTPAPVPTQSAQPLILVLNGVISPLWAIGAKLAVLNTPEAVEEVLSSALQDTIEVLKSGVSALEGLANIPVEQILINPDTGTQLDAGGIAALLSSVLGAALTNLQYLLNFVPGTAKDSVAPLVDEIAGLLAQLSSGVLNLVGNLATDVLNDTVSSISRSVSFIITLNNKDLLTALNISS